MPFNFYAETSFTEMFRQIFWHPCPQLSEQQTSANGPYKVLSASMSAQFSCSVND